MPRFLLSSLFTPWFSAATLPSREGWYRVRKEPLSHSWWSGMFYFDGKEWFEFGQHAGMRVRHAVKVHQWQGLRIPAGQAVILVRANMPKTAGARRGFERFIREALVAA